MCDEHVGGLHLGIPFLPSQITKTYFDLHFHIITPLFCSEYIVLSRSYLFRNIFFQPPTKHKYENLLEELLPPVVRLCHVKTMDFKSFSEKGLDNEVITIERVKKVRFTTTYSRIYDIEMENWIHIEPFLPSRMKLNGEFLGSRIEQPHYFPPQHTIMYCRCL